MRNEAGEASPGRSNSYKVLQYILQRRRHGFNQFFTEVIGHQETELSESPAIQVVEITSAKEPLFHSTLHISQFAFPSVLQHLFQTEWHSVKWRPALGHPCSYQPSSHSPAKAVPRRPFDQRQQVRSSLSAFLLSYHRERWKGAAVLGANLNPCQTGLYETSIKLR